MGDETDTSTDGDRSQGTYLTIAAGLLLVICVVLGFLWLSERNRRFRVERELRSLRHEAQARGFQALLGGTLTTSAPASQRARPTTRGADQTNTSKAHR